MIANGHAFESQIVIRNLAVTRETVTPIAQRHIVSLANR